MATGGDRYYPNPYVGQENILVKNESEFQATIRENGLRLLTILESGLGSEKKSSDSSVYTGSAGIALLYWHLSTLYPDQEYRQKSLDLIKNSLSTLKMSRMTFLCGDAGPLALGVVLADQSGNMDLRAKLRKSLVSFYEHAAINNPDTANEVLYGRAGYLYSLLFVNAKCSEPIVDAELITKMVNLIIAEGKRSRHQYLYYEWHDTCYIGAAHGILGILYMLLKSYKLDADGLDWVRKTIDWVLSQRFPSGNVPSSKNSEKDSLIHWCHGAPGAIYLFIEAFKIYGDERYLNAAKDCANVIWERGFLRKGYSICHGVAGNAYGLMAMYTYTKQVKYLRQAYLMAQWCFSYGSKANRTPDRPLSLFEGLAGVVYMLNDFGSGLEPNFPAFQL